MVVSQNFGRGVFKICWILRVVRTSPTCRLVLFELGHGSEGRYLVDHHAGTKLSGVLSIVRRLGEPFILEAQPSLKGDLGHCSVQTRVNSPPGFVSFSRHRHLFALFLPVVRDLLYPELSSPR